MGNTTAPNRPDLLPAPIPEAPKKKVVHLYWLLASVAWFVGAFVALRRLAPFPPPDAFRFFLRTWLPVGVAGVFVSRIGRRPVRRAAGAALVIVAVVLPSVAAEVVPGVKQPPEFPLPGGMWVAGAAAPDGSTDLYLIKGSADDMIAYGETPWFESGAVLSHDRRHIVFSSDRFGSMDLFVMDLDVDGITIGTRRLTTDDTADEKAPSWSPDDSEIVFAMTGARRWR